MRPQDEAPTSGPRATYDDLQEGMRIEIRGSLTAEGEEPTYGAWFTAMVANQDRVGEPERTTHFLVVTVDGRLLFRAYADEGKTWQLVPDVRRG